ncbi:hypothetical protein, partial [uncultured Pseudoflavonifractor sp.]|uniref:hypothetical protein n=1 Tax=uncultured Pseudoflavonifractor sp. TaxID=1221379 RepID=UPI0025CBFBFC
MSTISSCGEGCNAETLLYQCIATKQHKQEHGQSPDSCTGHPAMGLRNGCGAAMSAEYMKRPANKSQVEISGFGGSEKGNTKSSR